MAGTAGEEAALPAATPQLQAVPHHGDQPQVARQLTAGRQSTGVRTPARYQG